MASRCIAGSLLRQYIRSSIKQTVLLSDTGRVRSRPFGALTSPIAGSPGTRRMLSGPAHATTGGGSNGGGSGKPVGSGGSGQPHQPEGSSGGLWAWYMSCLDSNPLLTKSLTCALLNALGDIFCQLFIEGGKLDLKRTGTFTFIGLALVGPTLHWWYSLLNKLVPARGSTGAAIQLLLDQGVFAPVFLATFISVLFTIEGKPDLIVPKLKQDLLETVKVNWVLWIPAQYFNFRFVPPNLQVLTANMVALIWNTYMSFQSHKAVAQPAAGKH